MSVTDTLPIGVPVLRTDTVLGLHFLPDLLVEITDVFEVKLEALGQHVSQAVPGPPVEQSSVRPCRSLCRRPPVERRLSAEVRLLLDRIGDHMFV